MSAEDFELSTLANGLSCLWLYAMSPASRQALAELDYDCISLSTAFGSYAPLAPFAERIRGLWCPPPELPLAGIEALFALERIHLDVGDGWQHVDYRQLPRLHTFTCRAAGSLKPQFVNHPSLRTLRVEGFPKLRALVELAAANRLESLIVRGAPIATLDGLQNLAALEELRIAHCRALVDAEALGDARQLQILECVGNPKVGAFDSIAQLTALRWLFLHGKAARQSSYAFLDALPELQYVEALIRTADVDLAPLARHPQLVEASVFTHENYVLPPVEALRQQMEIHGRIVGNVQTFPKGEVPTIRVRFVAPFAVAKSARYRRCFVE